MNCISKVIKELKTLSIDGVFSMDKIELWLMKYEEEYLKIRRIEDDKSTILLNGERVIFPAASEPSGKEGIYLFLYEAIEKLFQLHKRENYFKQEMAIYKAIENVPSEVIEWLIKNEELGAKDYINFLDEYFDYAPKAYGLNEKYHLKVYTSTFRDFPVFINRDDFKNTIQFIKTFNGIYSERLTEIKEYKLNK